MKHPRARDRVCNPAPKEKDNYLLPLTELQIISLRAKVADRLRDGASKEFRYHGTDYQIGLRCIICQNHIISPDQNQAWQDHLKGKKHQNLIKLAQVSKSEKEMMQCYIQDKKEKAHQNGDSFKPRTSATAIADAMFVLSCWLRTSASLEDINEMRETFKPEYQVVSSNPYQELPLLREYLSAKYTSELRGQYVTMIFDETTKSGSNMAIIFRYIDNKWKIRELLARVLITQGAYDSVSLMQQLVSVAEEYSIDERCLVGMSRDTCSTNELAMKGARAKYYSVMDIGCFGHGANLLGQRLDLTDVKQFSKDVCALLGTDAGKLFFQEEMAEFQRPTDGGATRWYSECESVIQVGETLPELYDFIARDHWSRVCGGLWNTDMLTSLRQEIQIDLLKQKHMVIISAIRDFAPTLIKLCYNSESSNLPVLLAIDEMAKVENAINDLRSCIVNKGSDVSIFPTLHQRCNFYQTHKVPLEQKSKESIYSQWANLGLAPLAPVVKYFDDTLVPKFERIRNSFTAAKLFNPDNRDLIVASSVEGKMPTIMMSIPALQVNHVLKINCQRQWPRYLEAITSTSTQFDSPLTDNGAHMILDWWKKYSFPFQDIAIVARIVFSWSITSAPAERVFSILENTIRKTQLTCLQETLELRLMCRFNKEFHKSI